MKKGKERTDEEKPIYASRWFWIVSTIFALLLIHILFSIPAANKFCEAKWNADGLLTFLGTIVLGYIAVIQTHRANQTAERAMKISERLMEKELTEDLPKIDIRPLSRSAFAKCVAEKCLKTTVDTCYSVFNNSLDVVDTDGNILYFAIKNVCNHDILDLQLDEITISCPNMNCVTHDCSTSVYDSTLSSGESTALILTIPTKYYVQVAEYNGKVSTSEESAGLSLMLKFHIMNHNGSAYVEKIKLEVVNAEQTGFLPPVFMNKRIETPVILKENTN